MILKEARGIGTPATRAEIIKGLERQDLLTADGKLVVPPARVDPGAVAVWEMRLDENRVMLWKGASCVLGAPLAAGWSVQFAGDRQA
jgi:hypothetical protein